MKFIFNPGTSCQPALHLCWQPDPALPSIRWNPISSRWHPSALPSTVLSITHWEIDGLSLTRVSVQFASESKDPAVRLDSLGWNHQFYHKPQTAAFAAYQPEVWALAGRWPGPAQIWHLIRPNTWQECIASGPLPALLSERLLFKTQMQNHGHRLSLLKDFKAWMSIGSVFESNVICMLF